MWLCLWFTVVCLWVGDLQSTDKHLEVTVTLTETGIATARIYLGWQREWTIGWRLRIIHIVHPIVHSLCHNSYTDSPDSYTVIPKLSSSSTIKYWKRSSWKRRCYYSPPLLVKQHSGERENKVSSCSPLKNQELILHLGREAPYWSIRRITERAFFGIIFS